MRLYLPPLVWMAVIFWFSSHQRLQVSPVFAVQFAIFKTLHVIEYALLSALWVRALRYSTDWKLKTVLMVAVGITIVYAVSDEVHQSFVPTREAAPRDVVIDVVGACIGAGIVWKLFLKTRSVHTK